MDLLITWQQAGLILAVSAVGIVTVVALVRLHGLLSFAKMAPHDFVTTVAIGSVLAGTAMASVPLLQGVLALVGLFGVQKLLQRWRLRGGARFVDNEPVLLMRGRSVQWDTLHATGVTVDDVRSKLREANVLTYDQVRAVVLESTGDIAVLHGPVEGPALEPDLLADVRGALDGSTPSSWAAVGGPSPLAPPSGAADAGA